MSQFVGKVALITGGNAGIGRAAAIEFAKQGAKVVVSGRREKEGHEVIAEIKALSSEERDRVIEFLVSDQELRKDLQDSLLLEARREEPGRPLEDVLRDLNL